jgi:hypothetical protein
MTERANNATTSVGQSMSSLAGTIRRQAPSEGMAGAAASTAAHQVETAGSYLRDNSFDNMARDLTGLLRRYPLQALLMGLSMGYLLARTMER